MKQVIVVRNDLNMSVGKIASQVAHASLGAMIYKLEFFDGLFIDDVDILTWLRLGMKKIVLQANIDQIQELLNSHKDIFIVYDAGKTEVREGEITCIAFKPQEDKEIDKLTGNLKLL